MIAYKYRSGRGPKDGSGKDIFERDMELLSQDKIYIPTIEQLNDPSEALVDFRMFNTQPDFFKTFIPSVVRESFNQGMGHLYDIIRTCGIYSLSKENANELMWAYYANGHTGYAVIFDTDMLVKSFEEGKWGGMHELDVRYSSKPPHFELSKIEKLDIEEVLLCLVGNKSNVWKHEAEHRLVFDQGGRSLKIDYRAIKGFVFGYRMNSDDIDYVMKSFAGRELTYYQIKLKDNSYTLWLDELKDGYPNTEKYCPNKVEYNVDELLESDKRNEGVGYKYRSFVEEALMEVSREPFVTFIINLVVSEDRKHPNILIWTKIKQDGSVKRMRSFEFEIINDLLVRL